MHVIRLRVCSPPSLANVFLVAVASSKLVCHQSPNLHNGCRRQVVAHVLENLFFWTVFGTLVVAVDLPRSLVSCFLSNAQSCHSSGEQFLEVELVAGQDVTPNSSGEQCLEVELVAGQDVTPAQSLARC